MRTYRSIASAACALPLLGGTALAGEAVRYAPPAAWVQVAALPATPAKIVGQLVILDAQIHVDGATVTSYADVAYRADTPQDLTQMGTLTASWLPDKGDLVVHRAELLRDGVTIDLLKEGKFAVLRREQQLEQRSLNGLLTATMQVAGAQVGDVLRLSYSTSVTDPALGGNVQTIAALPSFPLHPAVGRMLIEWPAARDIRVMGAGPGVVLPAPRTVGAKRTLAITLPLPKPEEMPKDAPQRYLAATRMQLSSFADWPAVSKTMAPLYATVGTVAKGGPIAAEVARIAAAGADPLARMAAALQLVQDRIGYFANGMNGGNYVPQTPSQTWTARSGDCKAKTMLLLAMLRELGIEGEPLLVHGSWGDGVPQSPPMPAAFNHVIVHARVSGRDYWLDGTGAGARASTIGDVPPFRWGLPVRSEGAALLALPAVAPAAPQVVTTIRYDQSYGIDMPALFELRQDVIGPQGVAIQALVNAPAGDERDTAIDGYVSNWFSDPAVYERRLSYDALTGTGTLVALGMVSTPWNRAAKRATFAPALPAAGLEFAPDRGRAAWRAIPVVLPGPWSTRTVYAIDLPDGGAGATLEGSAFDGAGAGWKVHRVATLSGSRVSVTEDYALDGGELPVEAIPAARAKVATLSTALVRVRAGVDARRSWAVRTAQQRKALQPLDAAYARLIAAHPDQAHWYVGRASFAFANGDYAASLRDLDKAVALDADADTLATRSRTYIALGDFAHAIADLARARDLDPSPNRIASLAERMGMNGQPAEGLALVEPIADTAGDSRLGVTSVRADLLAVLRRKEEGAQAFDALLAERPGDGDTLNAVCGYRGDWDVGAAAGLAQCDQAVKRSDWSAGPLRNRALVHYRLGKLDEARADVDAAIDLAPGDEEALIVRGLIKRKAGDAAGGAADIADALRRAPVLRRIYQLYGMLP